MRGARVLRLRVANRLIRAAADADVFWRVPVVAVAGATEATVAAMRDVERRNTRILRRVVEAHGWPGERLVGVSGAHAAWWIAMNSDHDPEFQRTVLPLLQAAGRRGDAAPAQWAFLHDRCCVHAGCPQRYGTQHVYDFGGLELYSVDEPAGLDRRRASVGLPPYECPEDPHPTPDQVALAFLPHAPGRCVP